MSSLDGFDGLWVAAGFSGHGFMIAPAVGRGMTDRLQGKHPREEIKQLEGARFGRAGLELESQIV